MTEKWKAINRDVHNVDGNCIEQLSQALSSFETNKDQPHVLSANTIFGKGVSFLEKEIKWHYIPLSPEEFLQSLAELDQLWKF